MAPGFHPAGGKRALLSDAIRSPRAAFGGAANPIRRIDWLVSSHRVGSVTVRLAILKIEPNRARTRIIASVWPMSRPKIHSIARRDHDGSCQCITV